MAAERGHSVLARRGLEISTCLCLQQETGVDGKSRGEGATCCPLSLGSSLGPWWLEGPREGPEYSRGIPFVFVGFAAP